MAQNIKKITDWSKVKPGDTIILRSDIKEVRREVLGHYVNRMEEYGTRLTFVKINRHVKQYIEVSDGGHWTWSKEMFSHYIPKKPEKSPKWYSRDGEIYIHDMSEAHIKRAINILKRYNRRSKYKHRTRKSWIRLLRQQLKEKNNG